jgi:aminomethyltransferase
MALPTGLAHNPTSERFGHLVSDWEDTYGQVWAQDYGDPEEEYQALREAVVVLEYSPIRKWFVDGPDAIKVVDSIFSRDVAALPLGRLAYGVIVDDEGFMYEELTVVKYSDERILLMGGELDTQAQIEKALLPGTTLTDRRDEYAVASIQGPNSRALLQRLTDADVSNEALPYYGALYEVDVAGAPASIFRVGFTAELGYEIMVPIAHTAQLWDAILGHPNSRFGHAPRLANRVVSLAN